MTNKDSKLIWEAFLIKEADNVTYKLGFFTGPHGGEWLPEKDFDNLDDAERYARQYAHSNREDDYGEVKWDSSPEEIEFIQAFSDVEPAFANPIGSWQFSDQGVIVAVQN